MEHITVQSLDFRALLFIASLIIGLYIFGSPNNGGRDD